MIVETRFDIGDVVFRAWVNTSSKQIPCPDCLGTKHWECTLPNGESIEIWCPTCHSGYEHLGTVSAGYVDGSIERLTIGSVGVEQDYRTGHEGESTGRYMCLETGIGSGSVYHCCDLHATREEAEAALPAMVETMEKHLAESNAKSRSRNRKDRPGRMTAYYRAQIRDSKKAIETAEKWLEREPKPVRKEKE